MEAYARPPADPVTVSPAAWHWQRTQIARTVEFRDLIEDIGDAEDAFMSAVLTGDAALIGKVVLAIRDAYIDRLSARELDLPAAPVWAHDAALSVLLSASVQRAAQRNTLAMAHGLASAERFTNTGAPA